MPRAPVWIAIPLFAAGMLAGGAAVWLGNPGRAEFATSAGPAEHADAPGAAELGQPSPEGTTRGHETTGHGSAASPAAPAGDLGHGQSLPTHVDQDPVGHPSFGHSLESPHGHNPGDRSPSPDGHNGAGIVAPAVSRFHEVTSAPGLAVLPGQHGAVEADRPIPDAVIANVWQLLSAGSYERAANLLRRHITGLDPASSAPAAELLVWLGLAEELAGRLSSAETAYARALRGSPGPRAEGFALAGLARAWLASGKSDESLRLASDLYLQSARIAGHSDWLKAEIRWLMASAAQQQYFASILNQNEPWSIAQLRIAPDVERMVADLWGKRDELPDWEIDPGLAEPHVSQPALRPADPLLPGIHPAVDRAGGELEPEASGRFQILLEAQPLSAILVDLAMRAGWNLTATTAAREQLTGRGKSVALEAERIETVLDALLLPLGLCWTRDGTNLAIGRIGTDPVPGASAAGAQRLLATFALEHAGDFRREAAILGVGNIALAEGDHDRAAAQYELLRQRGVRGELATNLMLNQALLQRALGRREASLADLYRAVDATWDSNAQATAWINIAELCIELGRFEESLSASIRAARLDPAGSIRERSAIAQAVAYLWKNNPWAANQAIFDAHTGLEASARRPLAGFLASYARYLGSQTASAKSAEQARLLISLGNLPTSDALVPQVAGLVSAAWVELGFEDLASKVLMASLATGGTGYWHNRLALDLAARMQGSPPGEAAETLAFLAGTAPPEASSVARLGLARLQLAARDHAAAVESARSAALTAVDPLTRQQAVSVMGTCFAALNEPHAAALCYAGFIPDAPAAPPGQLVPATTGGSHD